MTARPPPFIFRGQFTYAPTLRPAGFATVPAGFTEFGPPTDDYPHGTVSYAKPLRSEDVEHFDLEPLDPDDPMIWKRAFQTYRDEVYRTFSETDGFEQPHDAGGRYTLSYSTRPNVTFQVTMWQEDWTPTGHFDVDDFGEAAKLLWGAVPRDERQRRLEAALWKRTRDGSTTARKGNPVSIDSTESAVIPVLGVVALGLFAGWIVNKMWGTKQALETPAPETTIPQISGFEHDVYTILPSSKLAAVALPKKGETSEAYFTRVGAVWNPYDDDSNVKSHDRVHSREEWDASTAKGMALRNKQGQGPLIIIYEDSLRGGGIVSWLVPPPQVTSK